MEKMNLPDIKLKKKHTNKKKGFINQSKTFQFL
jgi:hypothetical protein